MRHAPKKHTLIAALLLLSAAVAHAAQPAVLQQVPDNAAAVLSIKNLKQITTKLANAGTRMKLPVPEDLLATLLGKYGISEGLDQNGSAAIVMLPPPVDPQAPKDTPPAPPELVAILPASDAKAMLKSFEADTPDAAGIMKIILPGDEAGFAVVAGKYVAMAKDKATLDKYIARTGSLDKKLSPDSAAALDANDLAVYVSTLALSPLAKKSMDVAEEKLHTQMASQGTDKTQAALASEAVNIMVGVARQFVTDGQAGVITFRMNDDEAVFSALGEFKPDSQFGKMIAAQNPADPATLVGLPAGKVLLAGAGQWNSAPMMDEFDTIAARILANPDLKDNPKLPDIKAFLDIEKSVLTATSGTRFAMYESADPANGLFNAVSLTASTDPQKVLDATVAGAKLNMASAPGLKVDQKLEKDAKTIKGVSLMRYTISYSLAEDAPPGTPQALAMINKLYGEDGLVMYYGIVGKQVLVIIGHDDKLLEDAVAAAQDADAVLSKRAEIVAANKMVPADSLALAYLPVSRWVYLGLKAFNLAPAEPPAEKAAPLPLTVSISRHGSNATIEMHIPMATVIELSTTIQENLGGLIPH